MIQRPAQFRFDEIVRKWLVFVEKRRDYLVELHMSGRWSEYYEEQKFKRYMREAAEAVEHWTAMAPRPQTETKPRSGSPLPVRGWRSVG